MAESVEPKEEMKEQTKVKNEENDDQKVTVMSIEEFGQNCILLKNAMTMQEQIDLYALIKKEEADQYGFEMNDEFKQSLPYKIYSKAVDFIASNYKLKDLKDVKKNEIFCCDALTYKYPNGSLERHSDRRRDKSVVFLYSIGCTANFYVHPKEWGGEAFKDGKVFKFMSGDMLFFDATKEAEMIHGVDSIEDGSTCPVELKQKYKELAGIRMSVQIRAS